MQRKVMISCAVTGSADTPGRNPAVPVTPRADRAIRHRCRQGGRGHRSHPCARSEDDPAQHGTRPIYREVVDRIRESGSDVIINLTTGPGARFVPGDEDPQKPGPGTTMQSAGRARAARRRAQARNLQPRHGQHEHGPARLRQHARASRSHGGCHPRCRRAAGAGSVRDRPSPARQAHDRERPHQAARACSRSASGSPGRSPPPRRP